MRTNTKKIEKRGRPRKFDEEIALQGAVKLFTHKGYAATSLDDLATAMSINRPSMYNAFGNKHAIYTRALESYIERISAPLAAALAQPNLEQAFEGYFSQLLEFYCDGNQGCMATSTMPVESAANDEVKDFYANIIAEIDKLLAQRLSLESSIENHQLTAQLIQGLMQTLSLRARSGTTREDLEKLYRFSLERILR